MEGTTIPDISLKKADKVAVGVLAAILVSIVGVTGYGLYLLLPVLIELAKNTIIFFAELFVLAALGMTVLEAVLARDAIYYKFKIMARNFRKAVVREDPIGVLDTVIHRFESKLEQIDQNMTVADGATRRQTTQIQKAEFSSQSELKLAQAAQRLNKTENEIAQHARAAQRWQDAADSMKPMQVTLANVQHCLERARDLCASKLEDVKNQKSVLSVQLEAAQASQAAVRGFKKFFGSNPDVDMQDMAIEEIERQSSEAEAEIDQFMRVMDPMLESQDLKKSADALAAMDKFNKYLDAGKAPKAIAAAPSTITSPAPIKDGVVVSR